MAEPATHALWAWQNFYVIVGSSAGALIGLQFVVIALIANLRTRTDFDAIHAFSTPTIVHFSSALTIAAVLCAPWHSLTAPTIALAIGGLCGMCYTATVFHRASRQRVYTPLLEDWIWYAILPSALYAVITVDALLLPLRPRIAQVGLFVIAAAVLALLLIGIRNAWDTITHIVVVGPHEDQSVAPAPSVMR